MSKKSLVRTGVITLLGSLIVGLFQLVSPEALQRAMAAIASAVWGS